MNDKWELIRLSDRQNLFYPQHAGKQLDLALKY